MKKSLAGAAAVALAFAMSAPAFAANASQNGNQSVHGSYGTSVDNAAGIDGKAFENVDGNVGVNVASGNGNQQLNIAHVDASSTTFAFTGDYDQHITGTDWDGSDLSNPNNALGAWINGRAFDYATGNVGANVAAGNINQQQNAAFLASSATLSSQDVDMDQYSNRNDCSGCDNQWASIDNHAFAHAHGSVGANVASGNGNQQMNQLVVAMTGGASSDIHQRSGGDEGGNTYDGSGDNQAYIDNHAFDYAHGNIGVNVAGGNGNQQANRALILASSNGSQSSGIDQKQRGMESFCSDGNNAGISNNAFANAMGNIGVNVAAGNGNQQANSLIVVGTP